MGWVEAFLTEHWRDAIILLLVTALGGMSKVMWGIGKARLEKVEKRVSDVEDRCDDGTKMNIQLAGDLVRLTQSIASIGDKLDEMRRDNASAHRGIDTKLDTQGQRIARMEGKINGGPIPTVEDRRG